MLRASTAAESGVDESVSNKFPGANVTYGSEATGREVPLSDGGDINPSTGKLYKDTAFDGAGGKNEEHAPERNKLTVCVATGPETKSQIHREENAGNDEVRSNIRN